LFASENEAEDDSSPDIVFATDPNEVKIPELTARDFELVNQLYQFHENEEVLEAQIMSALPQTSAELVVALRDASSSSASPYEEEQGQKMKVVGKVLERVMETKLKSGRDLLAKLLDCGEIRKLDSEIGKAARRGALDMGFFTAMNMNLADAQRAKETSLAREEGVADRYQILTHIYTRCQEEVEKSIPPGSALLNKLLRTDMPSVRANQLKHFLGLAPRIWWRRVGGWPSRRGWPSSSCMGRRARRWSSFKMGCSLSFDRVVSSKFLISAVIHSSIHSYNILSSHDKKISFNLLFIHLSMPP